MKALFCLVLVLILGFAWYIANLIAQVLASLL